MDFDDLYKEIILDHYKHPRNFAGLDHISAENVHENPSCGDSVKLEVVVENGVIERVRCDGKGCAISVASASMMSELLTGLSVEDAREKIRLFERIMRGEEDSAILEEWGELASLGGVIKFPLRVKCATLSWHAAEHALE